MKSIAASRNSSSAVSIRLRVSGSGVLDPAVGVAVDHAPGTELLVELLVLRVVVGLRLFLGVQVVEVAEELVEAVVRGQELVPVAEVVLAELARDVPVGLEQLGQGRVGGLEALVGARHPDRQEPGAERMLAGDEGRPAGGAALLGVVVGEDRALVGDPIDVRRRAAHHAAVVGADVPHPDVVAEDHEDVGLLGERRCGRQGHQAQGRQDERDRALHRGLLRWRVLRGGESRHPGRWPTAKLPGWARKSRNTGLGRPPAFVEGLARPRVARPARSTDHPGQRGENPNDSEESRPTQDARRGLPRAMISEACGPGDAAGQADG